MIEKIAHTLTRKPRFVALVAVLMLIPAGLGFVATRINYDILSYLPQDLPSSQGEQLLEAYDLCERELKETAERLFARHLAPFAVTGEPEGPEEL